MPRIVGFILGCMSFPTCLCRFTFLNCKRSLLFYSFLVGSKMVRNLLTRSGSLVMSVSGNSRPCLRMSRALKMTCGILNLLSSRLTIATGVSEGILNTIIFRNIASRCVSLEYNLLLIYTQFNRQIINILPMVLA
jgi:hypothetical protein